MYLNIIKTIYDTPIANILNGGKTETISFKVRNETNVSTLSTAIQHSLGIPNQSNKTGRRNEKNIIGKEEVKISLFIDDMVLYQKTQKTQVKSPRYHKQPQ
jgi:hypothetical protein